MRRAQPPWSATIKLGGTESEGKAVDKDYSDIINLPHHQSAVRKHMSAADRAAQFGSFAALTGHSAAISETARLTQRKPEPDEYEKEEIDRVLRMAANDREVRISITYFIADKLKDGGEYVNIRATVKRIDSYAKELITADDKHIKISDILSAEILLP